MSQVDETALYDDELEPEDEIDLDATVEAELEEEETDASGSSEPTTGYESNEVTLAGRTFTIEEPKIGAIIQILKVFGGLAVRGERAALRQLQSVAKNPSLSNRVVIFGMLAAFSEQDLVWLGSAVLQFDDVKAGRKWLNSIELELAPIIKAFFLNLSQSSDLRESISVFFAGLGSVDGFLEGVRL